MKKLATLFAQSRRELSSARTIAVCAMMGALAVILGAFSIYVTPSVRVGFASIPNMMVAMLFGPVTGSLFNGAMDILKYAANPASGPFFPGMTLVTMTAGLIYGIFFYRRPLNIIRVFAAGLTVSLICNLWLNTWCLSLMLGKGFWVLIPQRLIQNLVTWPLHSLVFYYGARTLEAAGIYRILGIKTLKS